MIDDDGRWIRQVEVTVIQIDGRADKQELEWANLNE
jgi:hypothetical protein